MSSSPPLSPYKGLIPYAEEDAQFFFGREQKREIITANLLASRLTLLHGPSGVGKSSVLRAGVAQHLRLVAEQSVKEGRDPDFAVVVFSSWRDDPVEALATRVRASVASVTGGEMLDPLPPSRDLSKTLQTWTRRAPHEDRPDLDLLVILDQFEEYFLYHPSEKGDGTFATELSRAVNNPELRVNFLISIREDALAKLEHFKGSIPTLFENRLSLEHLDQEAAREAIIKPIEQFNRVYPEKQPVTIEAPLVETILQQVKTGQVFLGEAGRGAVVEDVNQNGGPFEIETPFLQMVLTRLWEEEMANNSSVLRLATLNALGGAARIVRTHLDQSMETLSSEAKDIASRMFFHLVTPSGTKIAHSVKDLATFAKVSEGQLDPVLDKLADKSERILRPVDPAPSQPGVQRYEIFHDVLAPAILDWRTRFMQAKNQALAEKRAAEEAAKKEQEAAHALKLQQAEALAEAQRERAEEQHRRFEAERGRAEEQLYVAQRERKHSRQLRSGLVALGVLLLVSLGASVWAVRQTMAANKASAAAIDASKKAADERNAAIISREAADKAKGEAVAKNSQAEYERDRAKKATEDALKQQGFAEAAQKEAENSKEDALAQKRRAEMARADAEKQKSIAESGEWAAKSINLLKSNPEGAVQLAQVSIQKAFDFRGTDTRAGAEALHAALQALPDKVTVSIDSGVERVDKALFSADGTRLATSNSEGSIQLWNLATAKPLVLTSPFKPEWPFAFAADGKTLAAVGPGGSVLLFDAESGALIDQSSSGGEKTSGREERITALGFSKKGKLIATGWSYQGTGRQGRVPNALVWDTAGRKFGVPENIAKTIYEGVNQANPTDPLVVSPSGTGLAFAKPTGVVLVDLVTGKKSEFRCIEFPASPHPRPLMAFNSAGDSFAFACWDGGVQVWNLSAGSEPRETYRLHASPLNQKPLAFDSKLEYLATDGPDFSVNVRRLWHIDVRERLKVVTLVGHKAAILSTAFTPDGTKLVTASSDKTVNTWTLGPGSELPTFSGPWVETAGIAFSPDGTHLVGAIADFDHPTAQIWDVKSEKAPQELKGHKGKVWAVAYNASGTLIATGSSDGTAKIWDSTSRQLIRTFPEQTSTDQSDTVREVAFSKDGNRLATCSDDGAARIWDVNSGSLIKELAGDQGEMRGVAFSHDGARVATANADGTASVWDINSGKVVLTLLGHNDIVWKVAFSPDGKLIATASHDATAKVWDASSGLLVLTLLGHSDKLWGISFSQDGTRIATASSDKTARIWDAKSGNELLVFTGHSAGVNRVIFGANDRRLATSSEDGTVRQYTLDVHELMKLSVDRLAKLKARQTFIPKR